MSRPVACFKHYFPTGLNFTTLAPLTKERTKWMKPRRSLEIGDLVLIADENVHRGKW